jgi:hypothetical protein
MRSVSVGISFGASFLAALALGCTANSSANAGDASASAGDASPAPTPTSATMTPPTGPGWHSYDGTITKLRVSSIAAGSATPDLSQPIFAPFGRVDVHTNEFHAVDRIVISPPGAPPHAFTLDAVDTLASVYYGDAVPLSTLTDADYVDTAVATWNGTSLAGTVFYSRDGSTASAYTHAQLSFEVALTDRISAPRWNPTPFTGFADRPLPWEPLFVALDEPSEGTPTFASNLPVSLTPQRTGDAWGDADPRTYGVYATTAAWGATSVWTLTATGLVDLAGNRRATDLAAPNVAQLSPVGSASFDARDASATYYGWGPVERLADCGDGAPCIHIGPLITPLYGASGSEDCFARGGGIAVWLANQPGTVQASVRVTRSSETYWDYGLLSPLVQMATPGAPTVDASVFATSTFATGGVDSRWFSLTLGTTTGTGDLGVAFGLRPSAYSPRARCAGPTSAVAADHLDWYVRTIAITP